MASYHVEIKSGKKGSAAEHAKYIARGGKHSEREDLIAEGHGNMPEWTGDDPIRYWRAADKHERANGAAYRELVIALPNEFSHVHSEAFITTAVDSLVGRKPYQYAIHSPEAKLGQVPNNHVHLMYSDRQPDGITRSPEQTFARYNAKQPDRGGCKKDSGGKTPMELRDDVIAKRKLAADIQNQMLEEMGSTRRVDHRSHQERGIERQPERHLGQGRIRTMSAEERAEYVADRIKG